MATGAVLLSLLLLLRRGKGAAVAGVAASPPRIRPLLRLRRASMRTSVAVRIVAMQVRLSSSQVPRQYRAGQTALTPAPPVARCGAGGGRPGHHQDALSRPVQAAGALDRAPRRRACGKTREELSMSDVILDHGPCWVCEEEATDRCDYGYDGACHRWLCESPRTSQRRHCDRRLFSANRRERLLSEDYSHPLPL